MAVRSQRIKCHFLFVVVIRAAKTANGLKTALAKHHIDPTVNPVKKYDDPRNVPIKNANRYIWVPRVPYM